jgi:hypothetical protein
MPITGHVTPGLPVAVSIAADLLERLAATGQPVVRS